MQKICVILVGLPASGKTTFRTNLLSYVAAKAQEALPAWTGLSSDDIVEHEAKRLARSYTEVFQGYIKKAEEIVFAQLKYAADSGDGVILFDRTNMTKKARKRVMDAVLERAPDYKFVCLDFKCRTADWDKRLNSRPGKEIPEIVLKRMSASYQQPSLLEGFLHIEHINTSFEYDIKKFYHIFLNLMEGKAPHEWRG